jgi:hypothetical protein
MRFCLSFFAVAFLFSTPLFADTLATDKKKIEACIKPFDESGKFGAKCIGIVADPCIAQSKENEAKIAVCAQRELAVWENLLKPSVAMTTAAGFDDVTKAVAGSEDAWKKHRDVFCPVFEKTEFGPSQGGAAYCRLQITAQRVRFLRSLGWPLSHEH